MKIQRKMLLLLFAHIIIFDNIVFRVKKGEINVKHKGTVELHTERLVLRRLFTEDAKAMYNNWANDPEVTKFLTWPAYAEPSVAEDILRFWDAQYSQETFYQWAIVPKDFGEPIGTISVVRVDEGIDAAEVGYCIGQKWWHKGYTSEALKAVMNFLFCEVAINRLEARHDTNNAYSGAVMKKCGMQFEGVLRNAGRNNQGIVDVAVYSMLAEEYKDCAAHESVFMG